MGSDCISSWSLLIFLLSLADNGILHALFTSFTKGKSGQVLINHSLGAAYDMIICTIIVTFFFFFFLINGSLPLFKLKGCPPLK